MNTEFAPIFKLGRAERLQLVEDIWDSLVAEGDPDPVSDSKRNELRRRKEQYAQNPTSGIAWSDVKQRARFLGLVIYSVFHCSQDPAKWRRRLGYDD
jgi:putative addiction module component (TIGR02574 family)